MHQTKWIKLELGPIQTHNWYIILINIYLLFMYLFIHNYSMG